MAMRCAFDSFCFAAIVFRATRHTTATPSQVSHSYQVVSRSGEDKDQFPGRCRMAQFAQQPTDFSQPTISSIRCASVDDLITAVTSGATINGRAAISGCSGPRAESLQLAQAFKNHDVIVLVTANVTRPLALILSSDVSAASRSAVRSPRQQAETAPDHCDSPSADGQVASFASLPCLRHNIESGSVVD